MDTSAFFARKRQELQKNQPPSNSRPLDRVWWQEDTLNEHRKDFTPKEVIDDNHDFSRAEHLKKSGKCPNCNSTSFMKPSSSGAARCFDCGYIEGRQVNDLDTLNIMSSQDAKTLHVKQTADGGAQKYRARISRDANEIRMANAELEQSANGKAYVDS
jgi:hypothetical protein